MGKIAFAVTFAFIVELALYLFGGTAVSTDLFALMFNPTSYASSVFWLVIIGALGIVAVASFVPGSGGIFNIYSMYAKVALATLVFIAPIIGLWSMINNFFSGIAGIGLDSFSWVIASLVLGPLIIWWIYAVLDWTRGTDQ